MKNGEKIEVVEAKCPKCDHTAIVYLPKEPMPQCPKCRVQMVVKEVLTEGKYY